VSNQRELITKNIRIEIGDLTELSESMKTFGWRKELPALADEDGFVLVGHRRMKVAKELGIAPIIQTLTFGKGDEADAERVKLALASNLGGQPMTKQDRKRIAEHLYGEKQWTMQRIAEALNVTHKTISKDLEGFVPEVQTARPKGGRPKGTEAKPKTKRQQQNVPRDDKIIAFSDQGMPAKEIASEVGVGPRLVSQIVEHERIRRQAAADIDPDTLSLSAKEKLEMAIRQHKKKLDAEFEQRIVAECQKRIEETILPYYNQTYTEYLDLIRNRKGLMTRVNYRKMLAALHPDRVQGAEAKKRSEEAFQLLAKLEKRFLDETESPTSSITMPRTYGDLMKMRRNGKTKPGMPTAKQMA
jgi:ParB-like chromosome segregation protein Spo0J